MPLGAICDDDAAVGEGSEIPSWGAEDPHRPHPVTAAPVSGVALTDWADGFAGALPGEGLESSLRERRREALARALDRSDCADDRCTIHAVLGELYAEQSHQSKLAAEHFGKALELRPLNVRALAGMERLCRATEQMDRLLSVLAAQVDAAPDREGQVSALVRLAEHLDQHFVRPRQAATYFEHALRLDPEHVGALEGLTRCRHALREWDKLAEVLERRAAAASHASAPGDAREALSLLERLAEVRESKQGNVDAAIAAWRRAYELDTRHARAIQELGRLSEKRGDIAAAAAYRARLADLTDDARERARIHVIAGTMLSRGGRDPQGARLHFERALELHPHHPATWVHLQNLALIEGDVGSAMFYLERRIAHAESPALKARLWIELAELRLSRGDERGAQEDFEHAFDADPTSETAASAVLGDWTRNERWADAQRACDVLLAAASRDASTGKMVGLLRLAARLALALGAAERALAAAAAATQLAPHDTSARADLVDVCHRLRARADLHAPMIGLLDGVERWLPPLPPSARVKLAEVRLALGDGRAAADLLEQVLAHDGCDRAALTTLAQASCELGDWARAADCKHQLARLSVGDDRKRWLIEAAEIWQVRAHAPSRARMALEEALDGETPDPAVLTKLLTLWETLEDWEKLAAGLQCLGSLERAESPRAKYLCAAAGVLRDKLGDPRRAVPLYEEALDVDPTCLDAFEQTVAVLTDGGEWDDLAAAYRRMIGRLPPAGRETLAQDLHQRLGLLYRDHLGDIASAIDALGRAADLAPPHGSDECRRARVELLVLADQCQHAIAELRRALTADATRPATYQQLYELFLRQGAHDGAWCAANALVHLAAADGHQAKLVADFPPIEWSHARGGALPAEAWTRYLLPPEMSGPLTDVLRSLLPAVLRARMTRVPHAARMLRLGAQVRAGDSALATWLAQMVARGAERLGVPGPLLLSRPHFPTALAVAPTVVPALFVSLPALEALPPELVPCMVVRRLAELRPEVLAHALFPTGIELGALVESALRLALATPAWSTPRSEERAIARALTLREAEGLRAAASAIAGREEHPDVRRWLEQADAAISRATLLWTGDLDLAWRARQREPRWPNAMASEEWRREMLAFMVSAEHAALRRALGVNVEARGASISPSARPCAANRS